MANSLSMQITEEGPRNAVVKLTGILDSSDATENPAIALTDFINNDANLVLTGFRVDLIEWSMSNNMEVQLSWNAAVQQSIYPLAGRGRIYANNYGGFLPVSTALGYDGSINLTTNGYVSGTTQNFTVVLELIKLYRV